MEEENASVAIISGLHQMSGKYFVAGKFFVSRFKFAYLGIAIPFYICQTWQIRIPICECYLFNTLIGVFLKEFVRRLKLFKVLLSTFASITQILLLGPSRYRIQMSSMKDLRDIG